MTRIVRDGLGWTWKGARLNAFTADGLVSIIIEHLEDEQQVGVKEASMTPIEHLLKARAYLAESAKCEARTVGRKSLQEYMQALCEATMHSSLAAAHFLAATSDGPPRRSGV
jgi:hypothetical protein